MFSDNKKNLVFRIHLLNLSLLTSLTIILIVTSCDIDQPKKNFTLAIPENDYFNNYISPTLNPV